MAYPAYREIVLAIVGQDGWEPWSQWKKAMVPNKGLGANHEDRSQEGSIFQNIRTAFPKEIWDSCGIYEWKLVKEQVEKVVYVGSTCTKQCSPLRKRILQYCTNGSHKEDLINDALHKGYELHVRVKPFSNVKESREAENYLLARYNYAWNIRSNGVRKLLPDGL